MRFFAFLFCVSLGAILPAHAGTTVFAAASLRGVLEEVFTDQDITFAYGGSGTMARQVASGAPADVIVLAHVDWMDWLVDQGRVEAQFVTAVARNQLIVIGAAGLGPLPPTSEGLQAAMMDGRIAMGQRDAVPAGRYAKQWLMHIGAWNGVSGQLAETDNVRAAVALVAVGAAPVGIVYATDIKNENRVARMADIPSTAHDPIVYLAAPLTPAGVAVVTTLTGAQAQSIFASQGFLSP